MQMLLLSQCGPAVFGLLVRSKQPLKVLTDAEKEMLTVEEKQIPNVEAWNKKYAQEPRNWLEAELTSLSLLSKVSFRWVIPWMMENIKKDEEKERMRKRMIKKDEENPFWQGGASKSWCLVCEKEYARLQEKANEVPKTRFGDAIKLCQDLKLEKTYPLEEATMNALEDYLRDRASARKDVQMILKAVPGGKLSPNNTLFKHHVLHQEYKNLPWRMKGEEYFHYDQPFDFATLSPRDLLRLEWDRWYSPQNWLRLPKIFGSEVWKDPKNPGKKLLLSLTIVVVFHADEREDGTIFKMEDNYDDKEILDRSTLRSHSVEYEGLMFHSSVAWQSKFPHMPEHAGPIPTEVQSEKSRTILQTRMNVYDDR